MAIHLKNENVWLDQYKFMDAEREYYIKLARKLTGDGDARLNSGSHLVEQISQARNQINQKLALVSGHVGHAVTPSACDVSSRLHKLELENAELRQVTNELQNMVTKLSSRIEQLELKSGKAPVAAALSPKQAPPAKKDDDDEDDDDFDMFASDDEEDEEAERVKKERVAAYAAKKSKKPALVAKSSVLLDVKPWDDETNMKEMEQLVRTIEKDGLVWGQAVLKPVGFGIHKLTINCVVEDEKVSVEELSEDIEAFEDHVQSVDVAAFNKI